MPKIIYFDKKCKHCGIDDIHLYSTKEGSNAYGLQTEIVIIDEDDHVIDRDSSNIHIFHCRISFHSSKHYLAFPLN